MDRSRTYLLAAIVLLAGGLFLVDLWVPLGVSLWVGYVSVILLSLWLSSKWYTYTTTAACTALMALDLFSSPPGDLPFQTSAVNRVLGTVTLWMIAVVGLASRRTRELEEANRRLQQEIAERERLQA